MPERPPETEDSAFEKTARFLSYGARSVEEVKRYLKRRELSVFREPIIERLVNAGLLDDELLVERWIVQRSESKRLGRRRIRAELLKKGVDPALIETKMDELYDIEAEAERAYSAALKRSERLKEPDPNVVKRKLYAYLQARGFEPGAVNDAIRRVLSP